MINLYQLQSFVTVIAEGSMTAAADKLYLTQPAISQQIRNLEEELGVELLVRGVRQVKPTLQGEVLFDYAKRILQMTSQAEIAVKAMGTQLAGRLRIGTLNSLGVHLMSPLVSRLLKYNPKLSIKIDYDEGPALLAAFQKGELDGVILPETQAHFQTTLEQTDRDFLMREEMWLVASGKETGLPKQIEAAEMSKFPFISWTREIPHFVHEFERHLSSHNVKIQPAFESPNVGTLKRVIETGLGWGFLPASAIRKQVRAGRLIHVQTKDFEYKFDFYFYTKKKAENKNLIEVFYQALQQQERV